METPCHVCGGTDLNLVDGYYYCVECGTQDVTVRETVLEYIAREDGTFAHTTSKKIVSAPRPDQDMGPEWYKWHVYNFIMAGLGEELESLGAGAGFRLRLLWLWARYVQRYRERGDETLSGTKEQINRSISMEDEREIEGSFHDEPIDLEDDHQTTEEDNSCSQRLSSKYSIYKLNMIVMQAMLYAALNASESEIQVGDLIRFIKEDRVSCKNCLRFVPTELNNDKVVTINTIAKTHMIIGGSDKIRGCAMTLYKTLKLGKPPAANLQKLVSRYVIELCLPEDFKGLVFSLMQLVPVSLEIDFTEGVHRLPDYEGVAMAYIIIGLKICFGLDGFYEDVLCGAVERYNEENNYVKAYKSNLFLDNSKRLFSFREWSMQIEFRKQVLAKYYFPAAIDCNEEVDSQVFISHTKDRIKRDTAYDVSDEVMMSILDKLKANIEDFKTPKIIFPHSLTPMTTYIDVLVKNSNDPLLKELLGEDFTQYSIKYVSGEIELDSEALRIGVAIKNLVINPDEGIKKEMFDLNKKLVFVRNWDCENWLFNKPPKAKHVDLGQQIEDSNNETASCCEFIEEALMDDITRTVCKANIHAESSYNTIEKLKTDTDDVRNIFGDDFNVTKDQLWCSWQEPGDENDKDLCELNDTERNIPSEFIAEIPDECLSSSLQNQPEKFDREKAIETLLEIARKEYRITTPRTPTKRKLRSNDVAVNLEKFVVCEAKKPRVKPTEIVKYGQAKAEVKDICDIFYKHISKKKKYAIELTDESDNESLFQKGIPATDNSLLKNQVLNEPIDAAINNVEEITFNQAHSGKVYDSKIQDQDNPKEAENSVNDVIDYNHDKLKPLDKVPLEKNNYSDENIYDTKQLYLKLKGNMDDGASETDDDPKIIELICRKEKEIIETKKSNMLLSEEVKNVVDPDNDDDVKLEIPVTKDEDAFDDTEVPSVSYERFPGINNFVGQSRFLERETFNYWVRHYSVVPNNFEKELDEKFSRSFAWAMRLCAGIIETTTRVLYTHVSHLESDLKITLGEN